MAKMTEQSAAMLGRDAASRALGIDVETPAAGEAVAAMTVTASMLNGFGVCHGGFLFALADTAFAFACNGGEDVTVAAAASIDFLKPVTEGTRLTARAVERSRGSRTGVYDVTVTDEDGQNVALFRGRSHATGRRHGDGTMAAKMIRN